MEETKKKKQTLSSEMAKAKEVEPRAQKQTKKAKKRKQKIVEDSKIVEQETEVTREEKQRKLAVYDFEVTAQKTKKQTGNEPGEIDDDDEDDDDDDDGDDDDDDDETMNQSLSHLNDETVAQENKTAGKKGKIEKRKKNKIISSETTENEVTDKEKKPSDDNNTSGKKGKKDKKKKNKMISSEAVEDEATDKDKKTSGEEALLYLQMWKDNRANWTFKKVRQVWLLRHMYDTSKIPDKNFEILLLYLEGLKGIARETTISRAQAIIESDDQENPEEFDLERVKRLLQFLT